MTRLTSLPWRGNERGRKRSRRNVERKYLVPPPLHHIPHPQRTLVALTMKMSKGLKLFPKRKNISGNFLVILAKYANKLFEEHVPDADIKEKLLLENPIPSNLDKVKVLDDFVKSALHSNTPCLIWDSSL